MVGTMDRSSNLKRLLEYFHGQAEHIPPVENGSKIRERAGEVQIILVQNLATENEGIL